MTNGDSSSDQSRLWGIVPAGGAGTRLWPLSRSGAPKFLLDLTGAGRTLLQQTLDRIEPVVGERIIVVTGVKHRDAVLEQLPDLDADAVIGEPDPRDSMAAIGLAAAMIERRDPDAIVASCAADHVISPDDALHACLAEAAAVAATGLLVTLGIEPDHPATGFGYIRAGGALADFATAESVVEFVEKPDAALAADYVAAGYRWNAGMFVVKAAVLLDLLAENHPALARGLRDIAADPATLKSVWPRLEKIAIDHAVAEPAAAAGRVAVIPAPFTWDDVGDLASLAPLLPTVDGVHVLGDPDLVFSDESTGLVAVTAGRPVVVLGLTDVAVVDTGDAVLVTSLQAAQRVKNVIGRLRESGREDLT